MLNIQTNRTIQASVVAPGRVAIAVNAPLVTAAAAPTIENPTRRRTQ